MRRPPRRPLCLRFPPLSRCNLISWSTLVSAFAHNVLPEEAREGWGEVREVVVEGATVEEVAVADALAEESGVGGGGGGEVVVGHAVEDDEGFAEAGGRGKRGVG
ncbi:hypothetical protein QJS10_CPA01g01622 [Acorus calamus]|uniref:Uncharacterized protein n=1 Tax=Acorus calamus TaxID=4465 RepID=A0AAV9FLD8_ACOCL|nr:hypothetical protein QJS10_CPA01g01622 [Acorus calamus]